MVCTLNEQCSGICGEASFRDERLTLAERGKIDVFKINDDDDDEQRSAVLSPTQLQNCDRANYKFICKCKIFLISFFDFETFLSVIYNRFQTCCSSSQLVSFE